MLTGAVSFSLNSEESNIFTQRFTEKGVSALTDNIYVAYSGLTYFALFYDASNRSRNDINSEFWYVDARVW